MNKIAVIGMGYVGLPLALRFVQKGASVVGIDTDAVKVERLDEGLSCIGHISDKEVTEAMKTGRFKVDTDFGAVAFVQTVIICVPTPLNKNREPDLTHVLSCGKEIGKNMCCGTLVCLESSTYPGTTDGALREVLEYESCLKAGTDFHLAFSPERENPGDPDSDISKLTKIVGGLTPECARRAKEIYGLVAKNVMTVSSCRAAEAAKLLENIFRFVNIGLVNELKVVYEAMGVDIWEAINAARTKPFGFMPFYPGPGLGGHCIPIDPFYLTWKAREYGLPTRFIEAAGEVNGAMPRRVFDKIVEALNSKGKCVCGRKVLIVGVAYKPDIDDDRESPAYEVMRLLFNAGAIVSYHDPHIPLCRVDAKMHESGPVYASGVDQESVAEKDCVVIVTAHTSVNYATIANHAKLIVDTRCSMAPYLLKAGTLFKA